MYFVGMDLVRRTDYYQTLSKDAYVIRAFPR